jgi:GNAT superfamily N-acetyltransferase
MQPASAIEVRLLSESDIPAAMRLKEAAGWNQTEADWRRLLSLEPNGCFAAVKDGRLVGTTTTTTYDELAWIGMVLVDPEHRRQGIASQLMNVALEYLSGRVETIKLDATALGQPVYQRFGFEVESEVERWTGTAGSTGDESQSRVSLELNVVRELLELDRVAFNADRSKLLEALIKDACVPPVLFRAADGALRGYALARSGTRKTYVGPVVAKEPELIDTLLDEMLSQLRGRAIYIDINKECVVDTSRLSDRGFIKERDLIRMVKRGRCPLPNLFSEKSSPLVVAIAGPEVG